MASKGTHTIKGIAARTSLLVLLWVVSTALSPNLVQVGVPGGELMVIANAKGSPAELTMKELRSIFKGEKQRWKDGTPVEIVLLDYYTEVGRSTAEKVYGKTPDQLKNYWLLSAFAGNPVVPRVFDEVDRLERYIATHPGAIAVVGHGGTTQSRAIRVDGKDSF